MTTSLLLASCDGNTWAYQVESDDQVRAVVANEMFGGGDAVIEFKEEIDSVVSELRRDGVVSFEDGGFRLMPGGVHVTAERASGGTDGK